jgi:hypothetical protein|tara:strand:+ start:1258 stop:1614 length:357 start_codon:yes stop_codon:yes gene_type:complete
MYNPIYSSEEHKHIIEIYITICKQFAQEITTKNRYNNYLEVLQLIIEYSNGYGTGVKENNFYDWIMIIPINLSVATSGFFAGIETKDNAAIIRSYKVILDQMLQETVKKLDSLQLKND